MKSNPIAKEIILSLVLLSGLGWLVFTYRVLIGPLIISALIAYLLYPLVSWLSRKTHLDRRRVVPLGYLLFLAVMTLVGIYLLPVIVNQAIFLSGELTKLPDQLEILEVNLERIAGFDLPFESILGEVENHLSQTLKPESIFNVIQQATTNIVWIIIIAITSYHLLRDWERLRNWFYGLFEESRRVEIRKVHLEIKAVWQTYLRGQLLIMTVLGVLSGIGAAIMGVPGAMILGFLAGALALIPSLGPAVATAIAATVAWTQGSSYLPISSLSVALIVAAIFQGIQVFEGFWLTPRVMGRRMNIHPGVVLIAVVSTLFTLGALMTLIIVPLMGSIDIIISAIRRKRAGLELWDPLPPPIAPPDLLAKTVERESASIPAPESGSSHSQN